MEIWRSIRIPYCFPLTSEYQASADKQKTVEVGAELFVGNLDPMVDEKTLYDTFSRFGSLVAAPKVGSLELIDSFEED